MQQNFCNLKAEIRSGGNFPPGQLIFKLQSSFASKKSIRTISSMKKLLVIIFVFCAVPSFARHIVGGEIYYEYIGPGSASGTSQYKITLRLFRDSNTGGAPLD